MAKKSRGKQSSGTSPLPSDPRDPPASAATAVKLVAALGFTEKEAQALLSLPQVTPEQVLEAVRVNLHAIAAAFNPATTAALESDPMVVFEASKSQLTQAADHTRTLASATDRMAGLRSRALAAAKLDSDLLQRTVWEVMPQLEARSRVQRNVRETYATLFAYHHARNPGVRARVSEPPPPANPKATGKPSKPEGNA